MTVRRVMGTETEFGILCPTERNPIQISTWLVDAYASTSGPIRWDYRSEDPLNDARGFRLERASAHPSQLTDDPTAPAPSVENVARPTEVEMRIPHASNTVLGNGGRYYVDHAHPEYSSPEVIGPLDAARYDLAGDEIARASMEIMAGRGHDITVYKNNGDGKGASYGAHENYLVSREVNFDDMASALIPFLVTRQILCGSGRVGLGQRSQEPGFQISQRADYIENDIGLETTFNRPIINTRDESHSTSAFRRLHVIIGDANLFETSIVVKMGSLSALLWYLENHGTCLEFDSLALDDPVWETAEVSHDTSLTHKLSLRDGSQMTAIQIQRTYLETIEKAMGRPDEETALVFDLWRSILDDLETDLFRAADRVEWVAKYQLLDQARRRANLAWSDPKIVAMDLQWHDLRPDRSIVAKLDRAGRIAHVLDRQDDAVSNPPSNTRAYVRGTLAGRYTSQVPAAGWDSVTIDTGADMLVRVPLPTPLEATKDAIGPIEDLDAFMQTMKGQL